MQGAPLRERLRYAARAIDSVRHALAGPLQSTLNGMFVLRRQLGTVSPAAQASLDLLERQIQELRQRLDLVEALPMAFLPLRKDEHDLALLVEEVRSALPQDHAARLRVDILPKAARVFVDGSQLMRALAGLMKNAFHFGATGTDVLVVARVEARTLWLRVQNTNGDGQWPDPPELAKDPLYSTRGRSLGLGLAVAEAVAMAHAGSLRLSPEPTQTSVELVLPEVTP